MLANPSLLQRHEANRAWNPIDACVTPGTAKPSLTGGVA
ncbi:hypothetical protein Q31a_14880 [Aureliella helgolandensis]|uniref:Uncharacterized protein n=1 Tax=Aureliella helgolandensis TaxID=2527968 RepID=A0A518G3P5_9BACT|nr:hypothetical protein Q31a_14880 [Aureliella helgolandensis]